MKKIFKRIRRLFKPWTQTTQQRRHALVGSARLWEMKRAFQFQFLTSTGLKPEHCLFEIGCGTLRGGIPLIEYLDAGHYFGMDVRESVLHEARLELKESNLEHKNPTLLQADDFSQLSLERSFDYFWAFSVLIHMDDAIVDRALAFVSQHLTDQGVFYANVLLGDRKQQSWQGFPVVFRTMQWYSDTCEKNGLAVCEIGKLQDLGHVSKADAQDDQVMLRITRR